MAMKYQLENFNGSYDFRSGFHENWYVEAHIHEYCELLYCQSGTAEATVNGKKIQVPQKHLIWLPPNCIHQYRCEGTRVVCAVFSHDYIPLYFAQVGQARSTVVPVCFFDMEQVLMGFPTLDRGEKLLISGYLNLICARVLQQTELEQTEMQDSVLYQKVISYLAEHFREAGRAFGEFQRMLSDFSAEDLYESRNHHQQRLHDRRDRWPHLRLFH